MNSAPPEYRSFMLRIWREETDGDGDWRASLEDVSTGERRGFANLQLLCRYLWGLAGQPAPVSGESSNEPTVS